MINKLILTIFFLIFCTSVVSSSEKINEFKISGNDRISDETIILFTGYKINDSINDNDLNEIIKRLYDTNFFEDLSITFEKNIVSISLKENPLIQTIIFEGIKKESLVEKIKEILIQKEKSSFIESKIKEDKNRIINSLRANGYFFSEVSAKVKRNQNNTIDLIYNINLGKKALIKDIKFIGNKVFKDSKLRKVIISEEAKFWKFISSKKNLNIERIKLDEKLLKNYYRNNGYYNAEINSSYATVIEDKFFTLVFNINAGEKYYFNDLKLNLPSDYNKNDFIQLEKLFTKLKSKTYSFSRIEEILDEIDLIALNKSYEFVSATYKEEIVDKNKINLFINLKDAEKFYVDRVSISGNTITSERVIRNQLLVDEGDAYNELLINKSFNNIKGLGIFQNVNTNVETLEAKKTKIININVEEKPTGEVFAGAGTGTSGSTLSLGINENNYLGEGIKLGSTFTITDASITGSLYINEPNYKNSNKNFIRSFERSEEDYLKKYGYETEKTGFIIGTSYEQYKDIFFKPNVSNYYEKITTNSTASAAKRKQDGDYLDIIMDYSISLNKLNQNFNPSDGYKFTFSQDLPIVSEDYTLINKINFSKYFQTDGGTIFTIGTFLASANSLSNDDARITKRIFIPSRKLRGFEPGKIGPKDGSDFIGGNYVSTINATTSLPKILENVQNVDVVMFADAANIWGVDYDSSLDKGGIRSSVGVGLDWLTPVGPLTFSFAKPITKESTDIEETFRFNIGTSF